MARTEQQIEQEILGYKESQSELDILSTTSATGIWKAFVNIAKRLAHTIETLFDSHKAEIDENISNLKPHSRLWYRNKVLDFQYGRDLVEDTDYYDNTGVSDETIEAEKVVKYAAAVESGSTLIIKVAGENDGEKVQLDSAQETALAAYIQEFKDAGVIVSLINNEADYYRAQIHIYYDPLVLDSEGNRLDGTVSSPVENAVKDYIGNLKFNGEYTNMAAIDALQNTGGVVIAEMILAETKFGQNDWAPITARYKPDSGYLKVYDDNDLTITWIPYDAED